MYVGNLIPYFSMTPQQPPMHSNVPTRLSMSLISYMHPGQNVYWMTKRVCIATTRIAFKKYLWQTFHPITFLRLDDSSPVTLLSRVFAFTCFSSLTRSLLPSVLHPPPTELRFSAVLECTEPEPAPRHAGIGNLNPGRGCCPYPSRRWDSRSFGRVRNCLPGWVGEGAVDRDFVFADFLARGRRRGGGWVG